MRREYAGAARKARLASPLGGTTLDIGISCDDLTGWPDGSSAPFFIVIDRGLSTEEKILVESRTANSMTVFTDGVINGRGADGTTIAAHAYNAYVEHVFTATDADEANEHVNLTQDVHGVTSHVVGVDDAQTLTGKTISGNANTLSNIAQASVTGLPAKLTALDAEDVDLQAQIDALDASKVGPNSPTFTGTVVLPADTSIGPVSAVEIGFLDGVTSGLQAQINAAVADAVSKTLADAKGDLFVASAADTVDRLAVGLDGLVLTADASQPFGLRWGAGGGDSVVPVGGTTGQILAKASDSDYDLEWIDAPTGGGGGYSVIVSAPYPTGGTVTTYTDGVTGYGYRVHTFDYSGAADSFVNPSDMFGTVLLVGGGGRGQDGGYPVPNGSGGGGGSVYEQVHAFGNGTHNLYVGRGQQTGGSGGEDTLLEGVPGTITSTTIIARGGKVGTDATPSYGSTNGGLTTDSTLFTSNAGGGASPSQISGQVIGGTASDITGSSVAYGVGGGASQTSNGASGTAGTDGRGNGGQGGAAGFPPGSAGAGGHGVVIISYRTS